MNKFCVTVALYITLIFSLPVTAQIQLVGKQSLGKDGYGCALGDLNQDGFLDIYIANADLGPDQVWFNDGKGSFTNSGQNIGTLGKRDRSIALGDLNGDGFLDVFIANDCSLKNPDYKQGYPNEVWLNDGTGKFVDSGQRLGKNPSVAVSLGDIDNDGDLDAAVANLHTLEGDSVSNKLWINENGIFTESPIEFGKYGRGVKIIDLNNDSLPDVIFDDVLWINQSNLKFSKSEQSIPSLLFADIDNDSDLDAIKIIGGNPGARGADQIWINDGKGNFSDSGQRLGNSIGNSATVFDLDNDGDLDLYVANGCYPIPEPDKIWINMGGIQKGTIGVFEESRIIFASTRSWEVKSGDLDNDGDLDVVVTNGWGNHEDNKVYINSPDTISTGINNKSGLYNFQLHQNYPNPFNPSTTINFMIPFVDAPSNVEVPITLKVYDILGREITTLVNENKSPGNYEVEFDGSSLSSGVYFYQMKTDNQILQKKMLMIK